MSVAINTSGDDNRNGVCYAEFHDGDGHWQRGIDLARNVSSPLQFIGSIFFLDKGKTYYVRATCVDLDGVSGSAEATAATENREWPENTGNQYWVGIENCNDNGPGTENQPWCSLQHAQDMAQPGDTVNIKPGVYYQQVNFTKSGQPGRPITFRGSGSGVYIDGSNTALLHSNNWVARPDLGERIYSIPLNIAPKFIAVGDPREGGDYGRLFNDNDSPDTDWQTNWNNFLNGWCFPNDYILRTCLNYGWIYDEANRTLFVRLPESIDINPAHHTMHINTYPDDGVFTAFKVYDRDWLNFRNLDFRYAHVGIHIKTGNHIHIADSSFAFGKAGIRARAGSSYNTFENNTFFDNNFFGMPWEVAKIGIQERTAIYGPREENGATNNIIRNNFIDGVADGISVTAKDSDIYNNKIIHFLDDAFEQDVYGPTQNVRLWNNEALHGFDGFSVSPFYNLMYVINNTFLDFIPYTLKVKADGGWRGVKFYNNTLYTEQNPPYVRGRIISASGSFEEFDFRNNIMRSQLRTVEVDNAPVQKNWFDYNLHWTADPTEFWSWSGYYFRNIQEVRNQFGYEMHGVEANPLLARYGEGSAELSGASPAVDAGQLIPGLHCAQSDDINQNQKYCLHWKGSAPDIGAFEYRAASFHITPFSDFYSAGDQGGPFSSPSKIYTISNTSDSSLDWFVSASQPWLTVNPSSGTLGGGANVNVTVSINSNANSLLPGTYNDILNFVNQTNGNGNTSRNIQLTVRGVVLPPPPPPSTHNLSVSKSGTGDGTITSNPAGINCGSDCGETYNAGTEVTLTATQDSNSRFDGWTGACSDTGNCNLTMDSDKSVNAVLSNIQSPPPPPPPLPPPPTIPPPSLPPSPPPGNCNNGETYACDIGGCSGILTCVNGNWGSCVKSNLCCGVSCDDSNSCTRDSCGNGSCSHANICLGPLPLKPDMDKINETLSHVGQSFKNVLYILNGVAILAFLIALFY